MAEEQIIINLTKEELGELERLAKLAGADSVISFARQILLTKLNNETMSDNSQEKTSIKNAVGDLRRLHTELKTFVAESLANMQAPINDNAPVDNQISDNLAKDKSQKDSAPKKAKRAADPLDDLLGESSSEQQVDEVHTEPSKTEEEAEEDITVDVPLTLANSKIRPTRKQAVPKLPTLAQEQAQKKPKSEPAVIPPGTSVPPRKRK